MEYRYAELPPLATVGGLAAPYEKWQTLGRTDNDRQGDGAGRVREKLAQGAFSVSLGEVAEGTREISAFAAHAPERVLGRTKGDTLRLRNTERGLEFELDLPDTTDGRDLLALIDRGHIGASIGFAEASTKIAKGVDEQDGTRWQVLQDVDLREISLTANPAYKDVGVGRVLALADRPARSSLGPDPFKFLKPDPFEWLGSDVA